MADTLGMSQGVIENYSQVDSPLESVLAALSSAGKDENNITIGDLEGASQFHAGGGIATLKLFEDLSFEPGDKVLDIGSGLGGPALISAFLGCSVEGIDLTPSFVETATALSNFPMIKSAISKNNGNVKFTVGDISCMEGIADKSIDKVYMIHVGMNLQPSVKQNLARQLHRVVKPGGLFGVFDAFLGTGKPDYPLPFATSDKQSFVGKHEEYTSIFEASGFETLSNERVDPKHGGFELKCEQMQQVAPTLLGDKHLLDRLDLSAVMGDSWTNRRKNYFAALGEGKLILRRIVFRR